MTSKRAAHFLLVPELAYSPPNDALVTVLLELGYKVDLFAPGHDFEVEKYGPGVRAMPVAYGYKWLERNLVSTRWLQYSLFSGTTEDPMAVAGCLSRLYRKPCITMADEIKNGSLSGNRSARWKALCRYGMRASQMTVVNETERLEIQKDYAGLPADHPMVVYPGCFRDPPAPVERGEVRRARGIPDDALVVCYSGVFNEGNGGLWLAKAVAEARSQVWFWGQLVDKDPLTGRLLPLLRGGERFVIEEERLSWRDAWASTGGVDIGLVIYLQDAPQFRHMGTASNRLCMFLAMGVPVVASRQPSFEFVERYNCGILIDDAQDLNLALDKIATNLDTMRENALNCAQDHIRAAARWSELRDALVHLLQA